MRLRFLCWKLLSLLTWRAACPKCGKPMKWDLVTRKNFRFGSRTFVGHFCPEHGFVPHKDDPPDDLSGFQGKPYGPGEPAPRE